MRRPETTSDLGDTDSFAKGQLALTQPIWARPVIVSSSVILPSCRPTPAFSGSAPAPAVAMRC